MNRTLPTLNSIALIGFGEAGALLAEGCVKAGAKVAAYDIKVEDPALREPLIKRAKALGVTLHSRLEGAVKEADLVISAVTASSAKQAAVATAHFLKPGQYFMDINSVSPATKELDRDAIEGAGAFYVESAVMAPVPPYGLRVPMLLGGPNAAALSESLNKLGFKTRAVATQIGVASAIKMCRSVMIKGLEALTVECMSTARRYGAEQAVLESLAETFPSMGWTQDLPDYLVSRVAEHGRRRAAEMREVVETLQDVAINPLMATATAQLQDAFVDRMETLGIDYPANGEFSWPAFIDSMQSR
mgnify:CR=1 FL=1